jgi:predicted GNAT family acetyltransferase
MMPRVRPVRSGGLSLATLRCRATSSALAGVTGRQGPPQDYPDVIDSHPPTESAPDIVIRDNPESQTYDAMMDGEIVGTLVYELEGPRIVITHTAVQARLQHRGIATELIAATLNDIRAKGKRVTILCPIVDQFIGTHPEYADLVDAEHPGMSRHD